jgi:hypothetical protein
MQQRLALLTPPAKGAEHEYLAGRRLRARAFIYLSLETVNRHVEELARFHEHAATVSRDNVTTFRDLTPAIEQATRELARPKDPEVQEFERITNEQLVLTARLAATVGHAREQIFSWLATVHDLEMTKHYAALVDLMEVDDAKRQKRVAGALARTVFVQGTSIAISVFILGPPGIIAGAAFGLFMDAASLRDAFKKHPSFARLDDQALQELDEFDLASVNWCVATELMIRRLRQVREQNGTAIDIEDAKKIVLNRFAELYGQ